jgi:hypothetical protein
MPHAPISSAGTETAKWAMFDGGITRRSVITTRHANIVAWRAPPETDEYFSLHCDQPRCCLLLSTSCLLSYARPRLAFVLARASHPRRIDKSCLLRERRGYRLSLIVACYSNLRFHVNDCNTGHNTRLAAQKRSGLPDKQYHYSIRYSYLTYVPFSAFF